MKAITACLNTRRGSWADFSFAEEIMSLSHANFSFYNCFSNLKYNNAMYLLLKVVSFIE